jgi:hypothetical protein
MWGLNDSEDLDGVLLRYDTMQPDKGLYIFLEKLATSNFIAEGRGSFKVDNGSSSLYQDTGHHLPD